MATLLVFLVLLIKLFVRNKLGARWHYLIWMLVLLKLLIPFGPESKLSIYNLFNLTNESITSKSYDVMNTISTATTNIARTTPIPYSNDSSSHESASSANSRDKVIYLSILGIFIWFIGAASVGIHIYKRNIRLNQNLKIGKRIEDEKLLACLKMCKKKLGIKRDVPIKEVYNLNTPALYGVLNPVLLIPVDLLNQCGIEQLKYAVLHELAHLKRRDIPMNFLLSALIVIHWFNPLIWYAFYKMRQDTEMACDELVLSHLEPSEQKGYGLTLIHLVEIFSSNLKLANAVGFLGSKTFIKKRINRIASYRKRSVKKSVFAVLVFAVLVLAAFTNAIEGLNINTKVTDNRDEFPDTSISASLTH
jgi:bla regulator protein BlaR1